MTYRFYALGTALSLLVACGTAPDVPTVNSNAVNGVGFGSHDQYIAQQRAARDAQLMAMRQQTPTAIETQSVMVATTEEQVIAAETLTALNVPAASTGPVDIETTAPLTASAAADGFSDEQNFEAVASRETIESDANRLQRNREQFVQVQPVAVPQRNGAGGPNIVAYALETNHPVGTPVHRRSGNTTAERVSRVCQSYGTDDQAQWAFLANGGPERDRKGVDPDGDGYACNWNPMPFRIARGG